MFILIYYSKAAYQMLQGDLDLLLIESRAWNTEHGITGVLAYIEGRPYLENEARFMQVLEGTEEEVKKIFKKIQLDPRHCNIIVLKTGSINARNFNDWVMKFEQIDLSANLNLQGFFKLDNDVLKSEEFRESDFALNFLKSF